jgi:long-chain acyl-CoA synthetase
MNAYKKGGKFEGMFPERWLPSAAVLLPEGFTQDNGCVNNTMKMVRGKINEYFKAQLEFAYTPEAKNIENEMNFNAVRKWNS